jgi:hypothetical protein
MIRPVFGDVPTAVSELLPEYQLASKNLKIYPNPATDYITVESDSGKPLTLMIVNARNGQVVKTISNVEDGGIVYLDDLAAGAYIAITPSTGASAKFLIIK